MSIAVRFCRPTSGLVFVLRHMTVIHRSEKGDMDRFRHGSRVNQSEDINGSTSLDSANASQRQLVGIDRRALNDRRRAHNLNYFADSGLERRKPRERRCELIEPRKGWVRVSDWTSAMVGFRFKPRLSDRIYKIEEGE